MTVQSPKADYKWLIVILMPQCKFNAKSKTYFPLTRKRGKNGHLGTAAGSSAVHWQCLLSDFLQIFSLRQLLANAYCFINKFIEGKIVLENDLESHWLFFNATIKVSLHLELFSIG